MWKLLMSGLMSVLLYCCAVADTMEHVSTRAKRQRKKNLSSMLRYLHNFNGHNYIYITISNNLQYFNQIIVIPFFKFGSDFSPVVDLLRLNHLHETKNSSWKLIWWERRWLIYSLFTLIDISNKNACYSKRIIGQYFFVKCIFTVLFALNRN